MEALLLSGGIDSIAIAAWRKPRVGITVDYGQVCASAEFRASRAVCSALSIEHHTINANCRELGSGDLAGIPPCALAPESEWWPFRNQLLITLGAMRAVTLGVESLLIGTVRTDRFHADGDPAFINGISQLCGMQEGGIKIVAPAIELSSVELVRTSGVSMDVLSWAHSCHKCEFACGSCRGCLKYRQVMDDLRSGES